MKTINYESDFKLIEGFKDGSSILAAPFRFTYYTKVSRGVYVAEYNGSEYVNCIPTEDGKVIVPFDSPKLGMGMLMVKREFFLNDADFSDGVCNLVSVESTGITLDKGATDDLGEIEVLVEPYYHTINGGGGSALDVTFDGQSSGLEADNVQGAIEEVNAKIDMYKEATLDFGTGEDTMTLAIMKSGTTITKVKTKNVKNIYLSYVNVIKAEYTGGEVALGDADFLVVNVVRTASDVDAVVGLILR